jgi:pilus assembly protein CpaF
VQGMEGDIVVLSDIFLFEEKGMQNDRGIGNLVPTGIRPKFTEKLEIHGYDLPPEVFMRPSQMEQLGHLNNRR